MRLNCKKKYLLNMFQYLKIRIDFMLHGTYYVQIQINRSKY